MVILSCFAKKNQNLNARKKSSVYSWKGRFVGVSALKTQLSVINWTFFPRIQIQIRMTILDCCISLKGIKKILVELNKIVMQFLSIFFVTVVKKKCDFLIQLTGKSKFEFEEKKFSLLLKVVFSRQKRLQTSLFSNKLNFFSSNLNFDFSSRDNSEWP